MKRRKLLSLLLTFVFMFGCVGVASAADNIITKDTIIVDGNYHEINTITIDNRKLVGIRQVGELLGAKIEYYGDGEIMITKDIESEHHNKFINFVQFLIYSNDSRGDNSIVHRQVSDGTNAKNIEYKLDVTAQEINNTNYLPLRSISELLCYTVEYDGKVINLNSKKETI